MTKIFIGIFAVFLSAFAAKAETCAAGQTCPENLGDRTSRVSSTAGGTPEGIVSGVATTAGGTPDGLRRRVVAAPGVNSGDTSDD